MPPDGRDNLQRANPRCHIRNFELGVLRPDSMVIKSVTTTHGWGRVKISLDGMKKAYGKYRSVLHGKTKVFALMARIAASKSPLYGSCWEQSPVCHVCSMTSRFSGSGIDRISLSHNVLALPSRPPSSTTHLSTAPTPPRN
jgi:hypothetical protein